MVVGVEDAVVGVVELEGVESAGSLDAGLFPVRVDAHPQHPPSALLASDVACPPDAVVAGPVGMVVLGDEGTAPDGSAAGEQDDGGSCFVVAEVDVQLLGVLQVPIAGVEDSGFGREDVSRGVDWRVRRLRVSNSISIHFVISPRRCPGIPESATPVA